MTMRIDGEAVFCGCTGPCSTCGGVLCENVFPVIDRLASYEDTGLEPEEITELMAAHGEAILVLSEYYQIGPVKHLQELAQAEKDGRLVVFPF